MPRSPAMVGTRGRPASPMARPGTRDGSRDMSSAARRQRDERRASEQPWRRWYKTSRWKRLRLSVLRDSPLCQCDGCRGGEHRARPSSVVDHKVAHRGDARLFWDRDNLQAMSKECHDVKTATEPRRGVVAVFLTTDGPVNRLLEAGRSKSLESSTLSQSTLPNRFERAEFKGFPPPPGWEDADG